MVISTNLIYIESVLKNSFSSRSKYVEPTVKEGFDEIVKVNFVPKFRTAKDEEMYKMFLLEK